MVYDLQKASLWKRIAAWMFDGIIAGVLAVGIGMLLSGLLGYDRYNGILEQSYAKYESEYGIRFEITENEYQAMTEAERKNYGDAYDALTADGEAMYAYRMTLRLSLLITTLGILFAVLLWEFAIPLFLGNGQTLGKKIFGLCLVRTDGVKVNNLQLFTRALLGKFTVETMIPVYILMMLFWGIMDVTGTVILGALLIAEIVSLAATRTNSALHDLMAGTAVVNMDSQMIFRSAEEKIEYQKKVAAEKAARQTY